MSLSALSKIRWRVVSLFCAAVLAAGPAAAQTTLDGKAFDGVFLARGKTSGDAGTVSFRDGRFHSSACDKYGDGGAPYRVVSSDGGGARFEATTESPRYGKREWFGVICGDKLDATAMMLQPGRAPVDNWVVAGLKK